MSSRTKEYLQALGPPTFAWASLNKQTKLKRQYLFFFDALDAPCCDKSNTRIPRVNSSIAALRLRVPLEDANVEAQGERTQCTRVQRLRSDTLKD